VSRLPLRLRLTLAFALAMAVVLAGIGAFLYVRLGDSLEEQLDDSLQARAGTVVALLRARGRDLTAADVASGDDEGFVQLLDRGGSVIAASSALAGASLLTDAELERAGGESFALRRQGVPGLDGEPARLYVTPVERQGETTVLVVGGSLGDRQEALDGLLAQLLIGGPLALALAALAGYLLAGAALRPVEAMRSQAATISSDVEGRRLPLPEARDEIRRLGETLNAMLDRLEAGLARERRFVADASHELRTPLALLRTELELALRRPRSPAELEQALRSAAADADRLARLAEDLLVLARSDEGELALRRSPIAPRELLGAVAGRFGDRASAEGRALEVDACKGELSGDVLRLEQALGNLVDNAIRHGSGTVRLRASWGDGGVELSVSDDGPGFPAAFLPRVFERFARADEARAGAGAGLGLAIVDAVARAHGGTARAENAPGGGASVSIVLPV
jgi:heavy metal sensor kinase